MRTLIPWATALNRPEVVPPVATSSWLAARAGNVVAVLPEPTAMSSSSMPSSRQYPRSRAMYDGAAAMLPSPRLTFTISGCRAAATAAGATALAEACALLVPGALSPPAVGAAPPAGAGAGVELPPQAASTSAHATSKLAGNDRTLMAALQYDDSEYSLCGGFAGKRKDAARCKRWKRAPGGCSTVT